MSFKFFTLIFTYIIYCKLKKFDIKKYGHFLLNIITKKVEKTQKIYNYYYDK